MRIISNKRMRNGSVIRGECLMIDKNGNIYPCIDNLYHPNPGTETDGYSEIERTIDWLYQNNIYSIKSYLDRWIARRVSTELQNDSTISVDEVIDNVMFCDLYTPCKQTISSIHSAYKVCMRNNGILEKYLKINELQVAETITLFLNENFLRVRAGGKLNPQGTNSIYFRISSHGYNWYHVISNFLWDIFESPNQMPKYIWIGHDEETNPPEIILFEGSSLELLDKFDKSIFVDCDNEILWI